MINKEVLLTTLNLIMITYYTDVVDDDADDADDQKEGTADRPQPDYDDADDCKVYK